MIMQQHIMQQHSMHTCACVCMHDVHTANNETINLSVYIANMPAVGIIMTSLSYTYPHTLAAFVLEITKLIACNC